MPEQPTPATEVTHLWAELESPGPQVGILMGINLYTEFRSRGLLRDAVADLLHWKFTLQGYRDLFVSESNSVPSDGFRIGNVKGT